MMTRNTELGAIILIASMSSPLLLFCCAPAVDDHTPLSPQDHRRWVSFAEAHDEYERALQGGFDETACRRVAALFEQVSEADTLRREALYNAGLLWRQCGEPQRARTLFERVVSLEEGQEPGDRSPAYAPTLIHLATYEHEADRTSEARALLEKAHRADERSAEVYVNRAVLQIEDDDFRRSHGDFKRTLTLKATSLTAHILMARLYLKIATESDGAEAGEKNLSFLGIVELICQKAVERAGASAEERRELASIHNIRGVMFMHKGKTGRAAASFETATKLAPNLYEAHINLGVVSLSYRDFDSADGAFREALRIRPTSYRAHLGFGAASRERGELSESKAIYLKARTLEPDRPEAFYNLGVLAQDFASAAADGLDENIRSLREAKQFYREVLSTCAQQVSLCKNIRPDEGVEEELRQTVHRRLKQCDETIGGLEEAKRLAAEAERLEIQRQ